MTMFASQWLANPDTGYEIDQSIRFNSADEAFLSRTPSSGSAATQYAISVWCKRGLLDEQYIFMQGSDASNLDILQFQSDSTLRFFQYPGSSTSDFITTQVFRDAAAWYHIVVIVDTTQGTAGDRVKIYVNGSRVTDFSTQTNPGSSATSMIGGTSQMTIGRKTPGTTHYHDGYMAEFNMVFGTPSISDFGETNSATGQWVPKKYTGSYGTNGFYLKGQDSSALGDDSSGNGNDFTSSGLAAADQVTDSPTNNMPTLNPLSSGTGTLSDGNLQYTGVSGNWSNSRLNLLVPDTGKWAIRMKSASSYQQIIVGLCAPDGACPYTDIDVNGVAQIRYNTLDGNFVTRVGGSIVNDTGPPTVDAQTFFQLLFDMDNGKLGMAADGASSGTFADTSTYSILDLNGASLSTARQPFVQAFSGTDANAGVIIDVGQSGWETTVTGFKNLTLANMDDPAITDPKRYFGTLLYTGNGTTGQTVTGLETSSGTSWTPDWVWIKPRSAAYNSKLFDSVRTLGHSLESSTNNAEADLSAEFIGFADGGFQVDDDGSNNINQSGITHVGWCWEAGGSGSSNGDGDITSTVSASTTSGFSALIYSGSGNSGDTVGHGLGVKPSAVIVKTRSAADHWIVNDWSGNYANKLKLNETEAASSSSGFVTAASSSTFTLGSDVAVNGSGRTYVAYCFAEIEGFNKLGSYEGNGNADGPFVYTGFSPQWILFRVTSTADAWQIYDTKRYTINPFGTTIAPNSNAVEGSFSARLDILSNGFKVRTTNTALNGSGEDYIFMAFAESPFKTANAR